MEFVSAKGSVISGIPKEKTARITYAMADLQHGLDGLRSQLPGVSKGNTRLSLPDHVYCLVSWDRSPRRVEFKKAPLGLHASFDRSMILLQDVVQVLDRPVAAAASQDSFLFHS